MQGNYHSTMAGSSKLIMEGIKKDRTLSDKPPVLWRVCMCFYLSVPVRHCLSHTASSNSISIGKEQLGYPFRVSEVVSTFSC